MKLITRTATNLQTLELIFEGDDGRRIIMPLDPAGLDSLIRKLGRSRAQLLPPPRAHTSSATPVRLEPAKIEALLDDASGLPMLSMAIPGMGFARVILPPQEASNLGAALKELAQSCGGGRPPN